MAGGPLEWITSHADSTALAAVSGIGASSVTAFLKGMKGVGILVSHIATLILVLGTFPVALSYVNDDWRYAVPVGIACGIVQFSVFRLLIAFADRVAARGGNIADKVVDKYTGSKP